MPNSNTKPEKEKAKPAAEVAGAEEKVLQESEHKEEQPQVAEIIEKNEKAAATVTVTNRTNQKHIVAVDGVNMEFLAGEKKVLEMTKKQAGIKFQTFVNKNILTIN